MNQEGSNQIHYTDCDDVILPENTVLEASNGVNPPSLSTCDKDVTNDSLNIEFSLTIDAASDGITDKPSHIVNIDTGASHIRCMTSVPLRTIKMCLVMVPMLNLAAPLIQLVKISVQN